MHRQVMLAVRDGQLAQLQWLRLTWAGARSGSLPIRQPVADAVAVLCVCSDVMPMRRVTSLLTNGQQVCNELDVGVGRGVTSSRFACYGGDELRGSTTLVKRARPTPLCEQVLFTRQRRHITSVGLSMEGGPAAARRGARSCCEPAADDFPRLRWYLSMRIRLPRQGLEWARVPTDFVSPRTALLASLTGVDERRGRMVSLALASASICRHRGRC
jgi:hypothetical protein